MTYRRFLLPVCAALLITACASTTPVPVVARTPKAAVPSAGPASYIVKPGDTLYSIARQHGIDHRDLIAWNRIENPDHIKAGVELRVRPPQGAEEGGAVAQPIISQPAAIEQRPLAAPASSASAESPFVKSEPKAGKLPYSEAALADARQQPSTAAAPLAAAPAAAPTTSAAPSDAASPAGGAWSWPANGKLIGKFSDSGSKGIAIAGSAGDAVLAAGSGKVVYAGTGLRGYGKLIIVKHSETYLSAYAHNQTLLVKEGQTVSKGQKIAEMGNTDADRVKLHFEIRQNGKPVDPLQHLPAR